MGKSIEAMKLALGALEADELDMVDDGSGNVVFRKEQAITALEEALAEHAMREVQRLGQEIEQEPVCDKDPQGCWNVRCQLGKKCKNTPPQRKPLTNEEIWGAIRPLTKSDEVCKVLVDVSMDEYRAIEAAHGIKENT